MREAHNYSYAVECLAMWLEFRMRHADIPGLSVTIRAEDATIFSEVYGWANLETQTPLAPDHLFIMASQTKMLTALAIALLWQDGKLQLDDAAAARLPWLREHSDARFADVTLRQLLSHRAGLLRDGQNADYWQADQAYPDETQLRHMVLGSRLALEPGSALKYSNVAYALLGLVVEVASGRPFETFVSERILKPLELSASTFETPAPERAVMGYGHSFEGQKAALGGPRPARSFASAIGLYGTTDDMARFMDVHLHDGLLAPQTRREMQRLQARMDEGYDGGMEFGLGLEIHHSGSGRLFGHSGHAGGVISATYTNAARQLTVSVAANTKDAPIHQIALGIFGFLDMLQPPAHDNMKRFNGILCNAVSTVLLLASGEEFLGLDPDEWTPFAYYDTLAPQSKNVLRFTTEGSVYQAGETLEFAFSKDGSVRHARLGGSLLWPEPAFREAGYPSYLER